VPFGHVEDAINAHPGLTEDEKAALWLFAFSIRDRSEQQRRGRDLLSAVGLAAEESEITEQARERREAMRGSDRARPREFGAHGLPLRQRNRSFLERVARVLNPR
jgi:hypothetical protein